MQDYIVHQESIYIEKEGYRLHLRRIYEHQQGPPVLLLHGSIENGKIFYSKSGKGLGPYLARQGYDVFVPDLRGKGQSTPAVDKHATHGQWEAINEDLPAFVQQIKALKGDMPMHWMAHSWGGVLLLSYLARYGNPNLASMVFFACKRDVRVISWKRFINIDIMWNLGGRYLCRKYGFMYITKLGVGADNEPRNFFKQVNQWVYSRTWIDPIDGFDYGTAVLEADLPPTLYLTGKFDTHAGHAHDVKRLMQQAGSRAADRFELLGKKEGFKHNYAHNNILTHKDAPYDHFPMVLHWMKEGETVKKVR
jgi:pimeloyl-ACP methyl ester carboxylesterase